MRSSIGLAVLFGLALAGSAGAQDYPVLSEADAERLLARLDGNLLTIAERGKPAMVLLDDLLVPDAIFEVYAEGAIEGLEGISWPYPGLATPEAHIVLAFVDMDHAGHFRDGIEGLSGVAADPACTNETLAHWIVDDDLSLALRLTDYTPLGDDGWVNAELSIIGGPPGDANCSVTSATSADLVDPGQITAFFERLRDDPIDLSSADAVRAWTAPYGTSEYPLTEDCGMGAYIEKPKELSGSDMLMITMPDCDGTAPSNSLYLSMGHLDMFSFDKLVAAADGVFAGNPTCSSFESVFYAISKNRTLAVIELTTTTTTIIMDYGLPIEQFDCMQ